MDMVTRGRTTPSQTEGPLLNTKGILFSKFTPTPQIVGQEVLDGQKFFF